MAKFFLKNPGFELGDQDWGKINAVIEKDAVNARSGDWVVRFPIGGSSAVTVAQLPAIRPGGKITTSAWFKQTSDHDATAEMRVRWFDKDDVQLSDSIGNSIPAGTTAYTQSLAIDRIAPDRTKKVAVLSSTGPSTLGLAWCDDNDMSGDIIEDIPATAKIASYRIVPADTIGVFDPLIGTDRFTEFNGGMSDKWSGVYTFIPALGGDLGELVSFIRRLGRTERLFCFDPDRTVPLNGIVNGMTVDGPITNGTNKIPVKAGPVSTTALVAGDYMEVKDQYFQLQRDLEIGPEGTGEAIVFPAVRSTLADGEDVITNNPKMVARITSDLDWRRVEARPVEITISWEEV